MIAHLSPFWQHLLADLEYAVWDMYKYMYRCGARAQPGSEVSPEPAFTICAPMSKMKAGATGVSVVVVVVVECARRRRSMASDVAKHPRGRGGSERACIVQRDAVRVALDADLVADADAESAAMVRYR